MAVYRDSRYRGLRYTSVKFVDGSIKTYLHSRKHLTTNDIKTPLKVIQITGEGDMLDLIASNYGNDETKWWIIADINEVMFPLELEDLTEVYVPEKAEFKRLSRG